jgi:uncharacterized protein involved in outer membrane biogenesis
MAAVKKSLLAVLALVGVAILAGAAYVAHLARSRNTPEFKKQVLAEARSRLGTDVRVDEMHVALLSGVTLRGVAVANPAPFRGDLLTADAFVLRYRLLPLLSGRVDVERLALEKPTVRLAMDKTGAFSYEKLMGGGGGAAHAPGPGGAAAPLAIVLKDLSVSDGSLVMVDAARATLAKVDDADLHSAFRVAGGATEGEGRATIATVDLGDVLFVRDVSAPLEMTGQRMKLAPIRAKVADGRATGDLTVRLRGGFRYETSLDLEGVSVRKLLEEAKSPPTVSGRLAGKAHFTGTAGLATLEGQGEGRVADCKVEDAKVLLLLSRVLKAPELANPDLDECRVEFRLDGYRLQTPVLSLKGKALQLTGKGRVNLEASTLDYDMTLALATTLLEEVEVKELRSAFKKRDDGFSTVDFRVYGSTQSPQTDLAKNIGRAAATEAVNKFLKKKKLF